MPSDRGSIEALRNMLEEADLLLETTEPLPENRTPRCRELLRAALALIDDLANSNESPAAVLGSKGGSATARKLGSEHFRQLAAKRKTRAGGRPPQKQR